MYAANSAINSPKVEYIVRKLGPDSFNWETVKEVNNVHEARTLQNELEKQQNTSSVIVKRELREVILG